MVKVRMGYETIEDRPLKMMIYGSPGCGKSTLASSIGNCLLFDVDNGYHRVGIYWRSSYISVLSYEDVLEKLNSLKEEKVTKDTLPYDALVFDTVGKLVNMMADYIINTSGDTRLRQTDGTLSMKGWGAVKNEFGVFFRLLTTFEVHLVFIAHNREEKDRDRLLIRPDIAGGSGRDIMTDLDLVGYMEILGGKRVISFSPSEMFYAKNGLGISKTLVVPELNAGATNNFLANIVAMARERQAKEQEVYMEYRQYIDDMSASILKVNTPELAQGALDIINKPGNALFSAPMELKNKLYQQCQKVGIEYDKASMKFRKSSPKETGKEAGKETGKGTGNNKTRNGVENGV